MSNAGNSKCGCVARAMLAAGLLVTMAPGALAYETGVHRRLTLLAFDRSVLADATEGPLAALGVDDVGQRFSTIPPSSHSSQVVPVPDLLGLGAIYEDHPAGLDVTQWRFTRHFFDPQQNGKGLAGFASSRQWVLEAEGEIAEQEFSLRDAQQFHLNALTHSDRTLRDRNLVLLLQSVGRAVHHLQDMSQPAHVRDDIHPLGADGDHYEAYTELKFATGNSPFPAAQPCGEAPIDLHQFDAAAKFWSDEGRGMADFASNNFVSQDTNFRFLLPAGSVADPAHPLPAFPASPVFESSTLGQLGLAGPANQRVLLMGLPVSDGISGSGCFNSRAVMESYGSGLSGFWPRYVLNTPTFDANYPLLLPRAINYSTGLIDYFFRGKLKLEAYSVVGGSVQVLVRNVSAGDFALAEMPATSGEEFSVYYQRQGGQRSRLALQGDDLGGETLAYGETISLSFALPPNLDTTVEKPFVLVFNGKIGNEQGIAALAVGPSRGGFVVTPNYNVSDGIAGSRVIGLDEGVWRLSAQQGAVAGNIDWRGHAEDEVLTWHGPQGRYFGQPSPGRSPNIYHGGKLLSVAPGTVIGAAITKHGAQRYLLAAVSSVTGVRLYRRPFQLSYRKDGIYDPLNNPLGWQDLGRVTESASSPMFFNASGTEGQVFSGSMFRHKVTIAGETFTSTQISNEGTYKNTSTINSDPYGSVEVNPGPVHDCRSLNSECTGGRGDCTLPNGNVEVNQCLVSRAEENHTAGSTFHAGSSNENMTSTVVCADYQGDTEVLCLIEADEAESGAHETWDAERLSTRISTLNQSSCERIPSGPQVINSSYTRVEEMHSIMLFKVGPHAIKLSGTDRRSEVYHGTHTSWQYGPTQPPVIVDYAHQQTMTWHDTKLLYVDARNDIVVYEANEREEVTEGTGSSGFILAPGGDPSGRIYVDTLFTKRRSSKLMLLADQQHVISSRTSQDQPVPRREEYPAQVNLVGLGYQCLIPQPYNDSDETIHTYQASEFFAYRLHAKIQEYAERHSVSAISQGMFVASLPIWIAQSDGSYLREGTWNYLSGGNLAMVLPTSSPPAEAIYVPTGIIR